MNRTALSALAEKKYQVNGGGLKDFNLTHLHLFEKKGFESDPESYKFTKIESFFDALELNAKTAPTTSVIDQTTMPTLYFMNGVLQNKDFKIPGIKIFSLDEKFPEIKELFHEKNALTHLHHSLLGDGVVLEIEKKTKIESPLRLCFTNNESTLVAPTIIVKAGLFSEVTILEENTGSQNPSAFVSETYFMLEAGSKVEHIQIDQGQSETLNHGSTYASVMKDASYKNVVFHVSGKLNRKNLNLKLKESGANGESYNLYLANQSEHSDINTIIEHEAPDTTSSQKAKAILDGESKGIFTGRIHIHQHAQRVVSSQLNKNLLLSKKAHAHSQPQLEIFADDVKCSHGSTTGQLSPDEIFYFEARGIPREKATALLAMGFGLEVVMKITSPIARTHIESKIQEALKSKFQLGGAL